MRVCFTNLGCKLNQAELEHLARDFSDAGFRVTRDLARADLHVVNTCTVTHVAARDSRKIARRGRRLNPEIRTVLTGCYVADNEPEARRATGADLIVQNHEKEGLLSAIAGSFPELGARQGAVASAAPESPYAPIELPAGFGNARALVKIEDGCNMSCSFCIIPRTRGTQRSRKPDEVLAEVSRLVEAGFAEIVLTGVQISAYRQSGMGLYDLTSKLLEDTAARRLRLTSIAPWHFDERLLDLFDTGRLCRHLHLSLQSGSNRTLERMKRPYTAGEFRELAHRIRTRVPGIAITTDVIAGFPGETEQEFEASIAFVSEISFARVHVFPYSIRPGTQAAGLTGHVAHDVKKARVRRLLEVAGDAERGFVESQLGQPAEVLWESRKNGIWHGTSDNYLRVRTESELDLSRRLTRSLLSSRDGNAALTMLAGTRAQPMEAENAA